ncbi:MAG: phosphotyrosine protein phosphatase [Deltaproteobacteria bacterium]|nr:phosphotyrosine protein phosphatase [Deltaproteobacteria bacterium]
MNVLFVCSRNRYRSPTAEAVFAGVEGLEVDSAGTADDADQVLDADLIEWADLICVMEARHDRVINRKYGRWLRDRRVVVLDIPDRFETMDPELVALLQARVTPHLRSRKPG